MNGSQFLDVGWGVILVVAVLVLGAFALPWISPETCAGVCGDGNVAEVSLVSCSCGEE